MSSLQTVPKKPKLNSAFQRLMSVHWWMAGCYLVLFVVGTYMSMLEVGRALHFWLSYTFLAFITLHLIIQWKVTKANWRRFRGFFKTRVRMQ
jgi:cytochrome b561